MSLWARKKAAERLNHRLSLVEDSLSDLERGCRKLDLEFTELYDKVRHQMSRMAKRDALARKENGGDLPLEPVDDGLPGSDPISRSIMMRRAKPRRPE